MNVIDSSLTEPIAQWIPADYPEPSVIDAVSRQAMRYGEQVRLLEDADMREDRTRIRKSWGVFLDLIENDDVRWLAVNLYYDAYAR